MLYLDSADIVALRRLLATGLFAGITTNPLILQRAGLSEADLPELHELGREHGASRFFAQATGATVDEQRASARRIAALGDDVVVKLVCTGDGLTVARELARDGREVLVTAVYHPAQMLLAEAAGAAFIAPYVGRASSAGRDGLGLVRALRAASGPAAPRILAASLRTADQVAEVSAAGSHDITVGIGVADALLGDELTTAAADEFESIARAA